MAASLPSSLTPWLTSPGEDVRGGLLADPRILNLCLTFVFVVFAYLSLVHSVELLSTELGRSLLFLIAVFWYLRAVEQVIFFGLRRRLSILFFVIFLVGGSLYAVPLL